MAEDQPRSFLSNSQVLQTKKEIKQIVLPYEKN